MQIKITLATQFLNYIEIKTSTFQNDLNSEINKFNSSKV